MAAIQLLLALSALTYTVSGAGVTNVQVTEGLNAFSQRLDAELSALNSDLAAQEAKFADVQEKLSILEQMLQQQLLLTCDTASCPNKQSQVPDDDDLPPPPPQNPIQFPVPDDLPPPPPQVPTTPALEGCSIPDDESSTAHALLTWNSACAVNTVNQGTPSCWLSTYNTDEADKCMAAAFAEAKKGLSGCVNANYGRCSCTIDATRPANFEAAYQESYAEFRKTIVDYKAIWGRWNYGAFRDANDRLTFTETYMKYDCRGGVGK